MSETHHRHEPARPLEGIRVVSLEQYIAGPYCTMLLADAGAEVIKVEPPNGEPRRTYDPFLGEGDDRVSGGFLYYNRNKRSVCLDLKAAGTQDRLISLLAGADVLVSNLRPGSLERFGVGYDDLVALGLHQLIVCEISGFGSRPGPYADWPAFDTVIQGMSGMMSLLTGVRPNEPGTLPAGSADVLAGIQANQAILLALLQRDRTGAGQYIDVSMYETMASFLERPLMLHEFTGAVPDNGLDDFAPVAVFQCADGWVALIIPTDEMWHRFCTAIERLDWTNDARFEDVEGRSRHMSDVIVPELEHWAEHRSRTEVVDRFRQHGQPAGLVQTIEELRNCRHLESRGFFVPIDGYEDVAQLDRLKVCRAGARHSGFEPRNGRPPLLGEGNDDLLGAPLSNQSTRTDKYDIAD